MSSFDPTQVYVYGVWFSWNLVDGQMDGWMNRQMDGMKPICLSGGGGLIKNHHCNLVCVCVCVACLCSSAKEINCIYIYIIAFQDGGRCWWSISLCQHDVITLNILFIMCASNFISTATESPLLLGESIEVSDSDDDRIRHVQAI